MTIKLPYDHKMKSFLMMAEFVDNLSHIDRLRSTYHYEAPIITHINAMPLLGVSDLANKMNHKVVLTGEGSDELFLGYPLLFKRDYANYIGWPASLLKAIYKRIPKANKFVKISVTDGTGNISLRQNIRSGFKNDFLEEIINDKYGFLKSKDMHYMGKSILMLSNGINALLHRNDRIGMSASLEARFPFLDEEMLRFGVNLPVKFKRGKNNLFTTTM